MPVATAFAPTLGHNNPPDLRERLSEDHAQLRHEIEKIADRGNVAPKTVDSDEDLGAIGDIVKEASKLRTRADRARVAEKEPHLTAGREIDSFFKLWMDRLDNMAKALEGRATEYQNRKLAEARRAREEEARRLREEEDRQRQIVARAEEANRQVTAAKHADKAEAAGEQAAQAEAAAQARAADITRFRSESGTVATTRTTWDFEVTDLAAVPLEKLRPYLPRADIEKAIRQHVRINKDAVPLAGVRIFENHTAAFR